MLSAPGLYGWLWRLFDERIFPIPHRDSGENKSKTSLFFYIFPDKIDTLTPNRYGRDTFVTEVVLMNLQNDEGFLIKGDSANAELGEGVASIGDINNDGFGDIMIRSSQTYIIYGNAAGYHPSFDLSLLDGKNGFMLGIPGVLSLGALGDVNGDGIPDYSVGSPFITSNGYSNAGEVLVVTGGAISQAQQCGSPNLCMAAEFNNYMDSLICDTPGSSLTCIDKSRVFYPPQEQKYNTSIQNVYNLGVQQVYDLKTQAIYDIKTEAVYTLNTQSVYDKKTQATYDLSTQNVYNIQTQSVFYNNEAKIYHPKKEIALTLEEYNSLQKYSVFKVVIITIVVTATFILSIFAIYQWKQTKIQVINYNGLVPDTPSVLVTKNHNFQSGGNLNEAQDFSDVVAHLRSEQSKLNPIRKNKDITKVFPK
jgi:hypothetical protein